MPLNYTSSLWYPLNPAKLHFYLQYCVIYFSVLVLVNLHAGFTFDQHNTPVFSYGSHHPELGKKDKYGTLVRVGTSYKDIGLAFTKVGCYICLGPFFGLDAIFHKNVQICLFNKQLQFQL